jgi:hypothetical protein
MTDLVVTDTAIRRDAEGRYSLNDLHRAAGGESKHQPSNWLRLEQTQQLCAEFDQSSEMRSAHVVNGGAAPGTYVAKELVYAYAMWISAAFQLRVIRAYDRMMADTTTRTDQLDTAQRMVGLVNAIRAERSPDVRDELHALLDQVCKGAGLRTPALAGLPYQPPYGLPLDPAQATAFWQVVDTLQAAGARLNHARDPARVAYSLPQVRAVAEAHGQALGIGTSLFRALRADRRFVAVQPVNSAVTGRTVKCWVFAAPP